MKVPALPSRLEASPLLAHGVDSPQQACASSVYETRSVAPENLGAEPAQHPRVLLTWEDVHYTIADPKRGTERSILCGIAGYVQSGEMLAILGPSGAGKTTLLDVLAQRRGSGTKSRLSGRISLNGSPTSEQAMQRISGYVQQNEVMHSYVQVEEAVRFSATLRTPSSVTADEIDDRVQRVLELLGIKHIRHSCIGNEMVRGISGGERKRCAVAVEMVTAPFLLFLDEPTTGLDTFTALHLLTLLKHLAKKGMAIIFSIHQPRSRIYNLFDRVLLLNGAGEEAFFGPAGDAVTFLVELGIPSAGPGNPADFLLDSVAVLQADEAALINSEKFPEAAVAVSISSGAMEVAQQSGEEDDNGSWKLLVPPLTQGRDIAAAFSSLLLPQLLQRMADLQRRCLTRRASTEVEPHDVADSAKSRYFRSWSYQVSCIAMRYLRNRRRDPVATYISIATAMIFAVLIGTVYFQVGNSQESVRNRMGVLFFVMMNTTFSSLGSLEMFLVDRAIYTREHRNGMYSASAYYVGKIIQDIPIGVVVNMVFNMVVYVFVGLQWSLSRFLIFDLTCALVMLNSYALCLLMSILAKNYATANILTSLLLVMYLLPSGGMLVSINAIPLGWRWIKFISFVRYAFAILVANEFEGLDFPCSNRSTAAGPVPCIPSGTAYAEAQGMFVKDISIYLGIVLISVVVYLLLGYTALRWWRSAGR